LHQQILLAGGTSQVNVVQTSAHTWSVMNETAAMDFLEPFTLQLPSSARTLADEDGRYFHFEVEQQAPNAFTPFTWDVNTNVNRLKIIVTGNLARITAHLEEAGIDTEVPMTIQIGATLDGTGDEVRLIGLESLPQSVRRDNVATPNWSWDAVNLVLTLVELDSGLHTWTVTP
jgi:hypothetical protein